MRYLSTATPACLLAVPKAETFYLVRMLASDGTFDTMYSMYDSACAWSETDVAGMLSGKRPTDTYRSTGTI
jgi:hypothetical protein